MGYYPTQMEVKNMTDEVRFSILTEEGQHKSHINREEFIRLFVNHRPVYGIGKNNITEAFQALLAKDNAHGEEAIDKRSLLRSLEREGEGISV